MSVSSPLALARELVREMPLPAPPEQRRFAPRTPEEAWEFFGLKPYPHQVLAMNRNRRFLVDVWHRRAGKSIEKLLRLLYRAYWCPRARGRYAFLGPTYSQVQDIAWAELRHMATFIPGAEIRDSLMAVILPTAAGSVARIRLYGVDSRKQRLRGSYLDGCVLDEFQHIPPHVWTQQVRPMLSDASRAVVDKTGHRNQWANFIGTPLGRNHLYAFYDRAARWGRGEAVVSRSETGVVQEVKSDQWDALLLSVNDTNIIRPEELAELRADLPVVEYAQEYLCDFEAGVVGAVFRHEMDEVRGRGGVCDVKPNPFAPVHLAFDLGYNDMLVVWFFQRVGPWVAFVDALMMVGASIPLVAERVHAMLRGHGCRLGTAYFPHDAKQTESGSGKDRLSIYRESGIPGVTVRKTDLPNGLAATRRLLRTALFDRVRCAEALDLLATYRREKDPTTGLPREEPVHDASSHVADALRTAAMGLPRWAMQGERARVAEF